MKAYDEFEKMTSQFTALQGPGDLTDAELGLFQGSRGFYEAVVKEVWENVYLAGVLCGSSYARIRLKPSHEDRVRHALEKDPLFWRGVCDRAASVRVHRTSSAAIDYPAFELKGSFLFLRRFLDFLVENIPELDERKYHDLAVGGCLVVRGLDAQRLVNLVWNFEDSGIVDPDTYDPVKRIQSWVWSDARRRAAVERPR